MMPYVPLPAIIIDRVMPALRDTEFRVLVVIARLTLGYAQADGSRKQEDWITYSQLKHRTGREGEAVSRAIDSLVRLGLIEVRGGTGWLLHTVERRRRFTGRAYYRLCLPRE